VQANVQGQETSPEQFAAWWAQQGLEADIMALLEVPPAWESWLRDQQSLYPFQAGVLRDDPFGLWVLSRLPGDLTVQTAAGWIPWVYLALAGSAMRPPLIVLILHPSPLLNRELAMYRNQQLAHLLVPTPKRRLIVGDFNLTPWSPWNRRWLDTGQLNDAGARLPPDGTWPARLPTRLALPIDRTWVSTGIRVMARRVLPNRGLPSDHRAVWSALCIDEQNAHPHPVATRPWIE
jgi:endonuclease/exonuclease/phosphatase (EEP) superfamily protein YafD